MLLFGLPTQFTQYFNYCEALKFEQRPDYEFLSELFHSLLVESNYQQDDQYDWVLQKEFLLAEREKAAIDRVLKSDKVSRKEKLIAERKLSKIMYESKKSL